MNSNGTVNMTTFKAEDLSCNYLYNPIGVESPKPRLCWKLKSDVKDQFQTAYHIVIASDRDKLENDEADLWDSGQVWSEQSIHVSYEGQSLHSGQIAYWKVRVWDKDKQASEWSEIASFEMGLIESGDWSAQWMGHPAGGTDIDRAVPAPLFRKTVFFDKQVSKARAYICGLGYYELYINGSKIGDQVLSSAFTRYDETVLYDTHDVTDAWNNGENAIGVILGNGWYNGFTQDVWDFRQAAWRHQPKFIVQVHITFADGEEQIIKSDTSWKTSESPIIFDGLKNGEFYDARLERDGWNEASYNDSSWVSAKIVRGPGGKLKSCQMTQIKIVDTIKPVGLKEIEPGVWVYDLGQNISGWAQIKVSGPAGTEITLTYSERIDEAGAIDTADIDKFIRSGAFQTDKYILKGEGEEIWEPRFVYHGFQYVQMTGYAGTPTLDCLNGRVVHTAFETRGQFECSNELLNDIQRCARWSTLTNYHGIPTDCPHREKNGWTGDASLSAEQVLMNFDPVTAYAKWMRDFKDAQRPSGQLPGIIPTAGWGYNWGSGPAWDSSVILIPWYIYEYCGDTSVLEEMYDNMKAYVDYMHSMAEEYVLDFGLGDWCPPVGGETGHSCPATVTDTAYFYVCADVVAKSAQLIGQQDNAVYYAGLAQAVREAFRTRFMDTNTGMVEGLGQTSLSCALYQGLVNEDEKELVIQNLVNQVEDKEQHLDTGILGTKYLMHTLTASGRTDLAYSIATKTTFPSWGHWIMQGATTLWEQWNGRDSRNHHMFSDISAWFYKGLAGINPDVNEPGFKHILLQPNPVPGLDWVNAYHDSLYGKIECNWKVDGVKLTIEVVVPVNTRASLDLPVEYSNGSILLDGESLNGAGVNKKDERIRLSLGSGTYLVEAKAAVGGEIAARR
ncbi:glycoside hydrolase family 78 protein [Bacillus sp. FJAT-28004]|uniref:glycoside hydrolase family 78 protein n=1 Tax=Bacillus sp. FJAT-28004 TaxID=1679165 RepID=UPI0006B56D3D|nr:glycoside hydrolase family 78 protein [Bacillus sp. FJAT-28004]